MVSSDVSVQSKFHTATSMDCHLCCALFRSRHVRNQSRVQVSQPSGLSRRIITDGRSFGRGVVRVDAYLSYLDINQCAMPHYVPNAFKGSDRCDYQSTVVCFDVCFFSTEDLWL